MRHRHATFETSHGLVSAAAPLTGSFAGAAIHRAMRNHQGHVGTFAAEQECMHVVSHPKTPRSLEIWSGGASINRRQLEQVFDEREHDAIHTLDLRVRRFDDVIFVRRMGAAAVAEAEMAGWQTERFAGEHVAGP